MAEAERLVQPDRRDRLAAADHRNHLAVAELGRAGEQRLQQRPADAAPDFARIHIDRIFEREAITRPGPEQPGIAIPDDPRLTLGDQKGQAARHDLAAPAGDLFDRWRKLLE